MSKKQREKLVKYRKEHHMSQYAMARKIGIKRARYVQIETGRNEGTVGFWRALQAGLGISDADMWGYICEGGPGINETQ